MAARVVTSIELASVTKVARQWQNFCFTTLSRAKREPTKSNQSGPNESQLRHHNAIDQASHNGRHSAASKHPLVRLAR